MAAKGKSQAKFYLTSRARELLKAAALAERKSASVIVEELISEAYGEQDDDVK